MTDCRVPRTEPDPDWEASRHAHEVRYWAAHLDEFVSFLPGIRLRRGDERTGRLMGDVLTELRTECQDAPLAPSADGRLARREAEVAGVSAKRAAKLVRRARRKDKTTFKRRLRAAGRALANHVIAEMARKETP